MQEKNLKYNNRMNKEPWDKKVDETNTYKWEKFN